MSYKIVINIIPAGDDNYDRFEQICYSLPDSIPEKNAIRLANEHAHGINASGGAWKAVSVCVYWIGETELYSAEL